MSDLSLLTDNSQILSRELANLYVTVSFVLVVCTVGHRFFMWIQISLKRNGILSMLQLGCECVMIIVTRLEHTSFNCTIPKIAAVYYLLP